MIAAVVLAAGAATRYGSPKQYLLLPLVLERLQQSSLTRIVVVEGAYPLGSIGVPIATCPDWERGPGASLRCGLRLLEEDVEAALVVLADGPDLDPRAVERVVAHSLDADVVAASYDGERSHPVCIQRSVWQQIPDEGARGLPAFLVDCSDLTPPGDVDLLDGA